MILDRRSPFFYVGDKFKLIDQLKVHFPENINTFYDVFCGGGSVSLNVDAKDYVLNDIDSMIIDLHFFLLNHSNFPFETIRSLKTSASDYGLSISEDQVSEEIQILKKQFPKTYYSKFNKSSYLLLRRDFNLDKTRIDLLYLLLIYGFNHMIRFNKSGDFNLPVGNVDWNKNVTNSLLAYFQWTKVSKIKFSKLDFEELVIKSKKYKDDFFYFDPPYLITMSEYNKLWTIVDEKRLYKLLDKLTAKGFSWGLSNMLIHKGKHNLALDEWSRKYDVYPIESNYISRFDNTKKKESKEIYVTNEGKINSKGQLIR